MRVLFEIVPAGPATSGAIEPLARKLCQSRLESSNARVVEEQRRVDVAWVRKLQGVDPI